MPANNAQFEMTYITLADLKWRWIWDLLRNNPRFQKILAGPTPMRDLKAFASGSLGPSRTGKFARDDVSGERTRLACWQWRAAIADFVAAR